MITRYAGRPALVTGETCPFGRAKVCRTLVTNIAEVRVPSRDEAKHDSMRQELGDSRVRLYVGDIRDYLSVERASRDADRVFHAAALKQVPLCEFRPMEAVPATSSVVTTSCGL